MSTQDLRSPGTGPSSLTVVSATLAGIAFVVASPFVTLDVLVAGFLGGWIGKLRFRRNGRVIACAIAYVFGAILAGMIFQFSIFKSFTGFRTWSDLGGLLIVFGFSCIGIFLGMLVATTRK